MDNNVKIYFQIIPTSGVPIYRQIFDQVKINIAMGRWQAGDFLPSVREVSAGLEINPMTVSKAYSLLEKSGVLEFVRGQGMRVPQRSQVDTSVDQGDQQLKSLLLEVVNRAKQMSLDEEQVIQKMREIWEGTRHE